MSHSAYFKAFAALSCAALSVSAVSGAFSSANSFAADDSSNKNYILGDASLDGSINATDAVLTQQFILGLQTPSDIQSKLSDVNQNGSTEISDVVALRRFLINSSSSSTIGSPYSDTSTSTSASSADFKQKDYDINCSGHSKVDLYFNGTKDALANGSISYSNSDGKSITVQWNGSIDQNGYLLYSFDIPQGVSSLHVKIIWSGIKNSSQGFDITDCSLANFVLNEISTTPEQTTVTTSNTTTTTTTTTINSSSSELSLKDVPQNYKYALDWIWNTRILGEKSTERHNTLYDQIVAGNGTLNYVIRWQSYKTITLQQRQKLESILDESVNGWTNYLVGYDGWKYKHVDVKIVGWAVLDKSSIIDPQPDEIIYDNLISDYDSSNDTSNGSETIPNKLPSAPDNLSRMYHFENNIGFDYPGGLDKRFDLYLWATQGFPFIGGCGGDWGQRLSDSAYLNIIDSNSNIHVLQHELGHGFGITDFYGGEGDSDGFPPGGFPNENKNSIMMAGSSTVITDFDGWMLRYIWSNIKNDSGRF